AFDFLQLNERFGCEAQLGGSDQWGNITAGVDLIRRSAGRRAYGLTCPLVTRADGSKFGKSEGGTVWLDGSLTSPYEFYQFWINADDASALNYLKAFTFLGAGEIEALAEATAENPGRREAQRALAREVTALAHGAAAAGKAEKISTALFYGNLGELEEDEIELGFHDVPTWGMGEPELGLVDLLVAAGISPSKRQARQDIGSGAIYVNGERCTELDRVMRTRDGLHGKYLVVRRGRSKYFLIR
ncbi:MAG: tyrosine--tRNA ligase, partial [Gemmatimonadetes bacterium]|nr:tyrosine--tRNA ligase [Gemmatimonadota bacterium]